MTRRRMAPLFPELRSRLVDHAWFQHAAGSLSRRLFQWIKEQSEVRAPKRRRAHIEL